MVLSGLLLMAAAGLVWAAEPYAPNLRSANEDGCRVWVSDYNLNAGYQPHYRGPCVKGKASGKGRVEWSTDRSGVPPTMTNEGYFLDGVYLGDKPIEHATEIEHSLHGYVVRLGTVKSGEVIVVAHDDRLGSMKLETSYELEISLNPSIPVTDDAAVKKAIAEAAERLHAVAPTMDRDSAHINVYATAFFVNDKGQLKPEPVAGASVEWKTMELKAYSNSASDKIRNDAWVAGIKAKQVQRHQQWMEFSKRNGIASWVKVGQIEDNPFKFEGKTVGMIVQLDHMLSRDTALLVGGLESDGGVVQMHGVNPDFPDHSHWVLIAAKVGQREALVGGGAPGHQLATLTSLESVVCSREACEDFTEVSGGIHWGEPYTPPQQ